MEKIMKCFLIFQFFAILSCKQFLVKTKSSMMTNVTLAKTKEAKEYGKVDQKHQIKGSFQGRIIVPAIVTWVVGNHHLLLLLDHLAAFTPQPPQQQPLQQQEEQQDTYPHPLLLVLDLYNGHGDFTVFPLSQRWKHFQDTRQWDLLVFILSLYSSE